ncbi:MAG: putative DNA binding domain-containing protein [Fibromonadales bacterium]|nr:putative DNA binding domain-containing protein [Fibromonadales bacterium]
MLLPRKESDKVEFKPALNNAVIKALVAFSNTKGGSVYVGIADNSDAVGLTLEKETLPQFINEIKNKTSLSIIPDAEIIDIDNKKVVVLSVAEYPIKPVSIQGKYYKRIDASNHLLSANEVANMHLQTINSSWDYYPRPNKTINDISLEKVRKAMNAIKKRNENFQFETEIEFLEKNELLLQNNSITNGCFLMFSKEENLWTTIQMGHFASEIVIKDDVVNSEDILTQIEDVMDFIRKHISKELIITDTQIENIPRWQYPLDALRELVLNMIIHRDYTASHNSIIKIFSDRILFFNPGILPNTITIEQLRANQYVSTPRNRQVAKIMKEMGIVERYGTGIKRVRKMFVDYGLEEPVFEIMSGGLAVTVYGVTDLKADLKTDLKTDLKINDIDDMILRLMNKDNRISIPDIAQKIERGLTATKERISKLKAKGLVERIGPDKGGYWKISRSFV